MEIRVDVKGISCHGSAPERGDNAIYKMADISQNIRSLNENGDGASNEIKGLVKMLNPEFNPEHAEDAQFLGRGTCTVSQIFTPLPSRCAVADGCSISVDRRMTAGETWDSCLKEIEALPAVQKYRDDVKVSMYICTTVPHGPARSMRRSASSPHGSTKKTPLMCRRWPTPTRRFGASSASATPMPIPNMMPCTCGSGPLSTSGRSPQTAYPFRAATASPAWASAPVLESQAHAPNEITWKQDLVTCAALYAAVPGLYKPENKTGDVTEFRQSLTDNDIQ